MAEFQQQYASSSCEAKSADGTPATTVADEPQNIQGWMNVAACSDPYTADNGCTVQDFTISPSADYPSPYNDGQAHTFTQNISCPPQQGGGDGCGLGLYWMGPWTNGVTYVAADATDSDPCLSHIVGNNQIAYICIQSHTADSTTEPGVGANWTDYWDVFSATGPQGLGFKWEGLWATSSQYNKQTLGTNPDGSVVTHEMPTGDDDWFNSTSYQAGDGVYDSNNVHYTALITHTSDPTTEPGVGANWTTNWEITPANFLPFGLFIAIQDHTSDATNEPIWGNDWQLYWDLIVNGAGGNSAAGGLNYRGKWAESETYNPDDVLMNNNSSYVCIKAHTAIAADNGTEANPGNEPDLSLAEEDGGLIDGIFDSIAGFFGFAEFNDPSPYWELLSKGEQEDKGFLGGIFDWLGDVTGWEIFDSDWFQSAVSLLGGSAIAYYLNEFLTDPQPEWQARFDGDIGYSGTGGGGAFTPPNLAEVITSICDSAGIQSYDVSLLPDKPVSFTIGDVTNYRSILEMLSQAYQFDIITTFQPGSGRQLKFKPKSTTSVKTLTSKDIGFGNGYVGESPYESKRLQGNDLPRSVEVSYFSSAFSQKKLTQSTIMRTYPQGQNFSINVPMSLEDQQAKEIADLTLMNAHLERKSYAFTTSLEHIELEAGDIVTVEDIGDLRIESVSSTSDKDGLLEFICVDSGVASTPQPVFDGGTIVGFTASSTTGSIGPTGAIVPDSVEEVQYLTQSGIIPLDLPPLSNSDRNPRIHVAVHDYGASNTWPGARYEISKDGGTTWIPAGSIPGGQIAPAVWGLVETAVPAAPDVNVVDETTTITVKLKTGALTSCTDEQFFNGRNRCMIGQELVYFRDVTSLGDSTFELSYLLRGRKGTDAYHETHVDNEVFVLIDFRRGIKSIPLELEDFRKPLKLRVATLGLSIDSATPIDIIPQFMNFRGWKVFNGTIGFDPNTNAFACRFIRRYKWDTQLVNGRSNLPDDDLAGYKVAIIDPSDDSILRDFVVTTPQFSYTADQQIQDFGSTQTTLKVSVVPMSKTIGPGHPTIITYGL